VLTTRTIAAVAFGQTAGGVEAILALDFDAEEIHLGPDFAGGQEKQALAEADFHFDGMIVAEERCEIQRRGRGRDIEQPGLQLVQGKAHARSHVSLPSPFPSGTPMKSP
jgi:hypothetical protein